MTAGQASGARLAHIHRYPVKSASGEALHRTELTVGCCLPGDRIMAVLHELSDRRADADGQLDRWLPKSAFLRGVAGPSLQAIKGGLAEDGTLALSHPELGEYRLDPEKSGAARDFAQWLAPLWPAEKSPATRLARAADGAALTDADAPFISILSLASLSALEDAAGRELGRDRWRANLWIEGWEPRAEEKMNGAVLDIGAARLRVVEPIGRCAATSVDTATGRRDGDMPAFLEKTFGHQNFGIYAEVIRNGEIAAGDVVRVVAGG